MNTTRNMKPAAAKSTSAALSAALLATCLFGGCTIRALTSAELFGSPDASVRADAGVGDAQAEASVDDANDASNANDAGNANDASDAGCPVCQTNEFCDELSNTCVSTTGTSMLSGVVTDACSKWGVEALVGIAGQHQCSPAGKGAFYFAQLPIGKLKLAVAKPGYELFETTVVIVPGGNVQNVALTRQGGCSAPDTSSTVTCSCTDAGCTP